MVLKKVKIIMKAPIDEKPTRFRFKKIDKKNSLRFGFRGKKLVEITKFKEVKKKS